MLCDVPTVVELIRFQTWDFGMVQGCICDTGFGGHDCSSRTCPTGDNPRTTGQSKETQTFVCTETAQSTFQLTFRGATTDAVDSHATAADLAISLQALHTIESVQVTYTSGSEACTVGGTNKVSVLFETELGDVPALIATVSDTTKITSLIIDTDGVGTSVKGTVENTECSDK